MWEYTQVGFSQCKLFDSRHVLSYYYVNSCRNNGSRKWDEMEMFSRAVNLGFDPGSNGTL